MYNERQCSVEKQEQIDAGIDDEIALLAKGDTTAMLREIYVAAERFNVSDAKTVSVAMARSARLLLAINKQADERHKQNMAAQDVLVGLTKWICVLTIALLLLTVYMLFK